MKTVTFKFVVENEEEADSLINEVSEEIGNGAGYPYITSDIEESTEDEIKVFESLEVESDEDEDDGVEQVL